MDKRLMTIMGLVKVFVIVYFILFLLEPRPMCNYPDQQPTLRDATVTDIEDRINKLTTTSLWLYHTGSSMYPTIKDGQSCLCEQQDDYEVSDIVSFYRLDGNNEVSFISHRIVDDTPIGFITKGDNNNKIDYVSVPVDNVFCKIKERPRFMEANQYG